MSDLDTQARIVHRSNQMREELKSLYEWEKDIKQKEAKRAVVPDVEVTLISFFFATNKYNSHFSLILGIRSKLPNTKSSANAKTISERVVNSTGQ